MKGLMLGIGALAAMLLVPATASAQMPVVLVCQDGTTQPGPSQVGCKDHGDVDWNTTNAWTKMRAGQFAATDTVACIDGQAAAASATACDSHGGVDSVSTLAAVKRRAQGNRYARPDSGNMAADSTHGYEPGATGSDTSMKHPMKDSASAGDSPSMRDSSSAGARAGTDTSRSQ
jgi:hypothetical protein